MAITDLQISDTLATSAPSIKYTGNEGPQAPQQMASNPSLEDSRNEMSLMLFNKPIHELTPEELDLLNDHESQQAPQQDSGIMKAAYGGMMRQKYGLGKFVRKLIPNEIARAAEVAAPFVAMAAPQFALPAALAGGLGTYDRTGKLGGALKSGALTYGLGTLSPGMERFKNVGGTNIFNTRSGLNEMYNLGSGTKTQGIRDLNPFRSKVAPSSSGVDEDAIQAILDKDNSIGERAVDTMIKRTTNMDAGDKTLTASILKTVDKYAVPILLGSMGIAAATAKPQDMKEAVNATRGTKLDIDGIRKEVQDALAGGEEAWAILQAKYPYVGEFPTKKAEGGRIGLYAGGVPSPYSMEDARKTSMQDKMGGITDVMKRADLFRSGDVGQMYMAEGGLMDMGGMEKDYRNDGGFVPIGGKEKADDVPARLSKNEFVFTADAVRGAGGGDIDKGAEMMENMMKNLEQGGQISEDSQGLGGAQEMFDVSERLGEVI